MAKAAKAKQEDLPGIEPPEYPILEEIAERVYDLQEERMQLGKREKAERDLLKIKMQEFKLDKYKLKDGKWIELEAPEPKAFVRAEKKKDPDVVESRAEVRETDEQLTHIKEAKAKIVKPEPTTEESKDNVLSFVKNHPALACLNCEHSAIDHSAATDACQVEGCHCDQYTGAVSDDPPIGWPHIPEGVTIGDVISDGPNDRGLSATDYLKWAIETKQPNPSSVARLAMVKRNHDEEVFDYIFGEKSEQAEEEVPLPEDPRDQALLYALTSESGSFERWQTRRERFKHGIPDKDLEEAIRDEFTSGQHERGGVTYFCEDSPTPKFWFGPRTKQKQAPTLQGVRLLAKAREVLGLKAPVKTKVTKNTKQTAAHV